MIDLSSVQEYEEARQAVSFEAPRDPSSDLAEKIGTLGLARIRQLERYVGMPAAATMRVGADASPSHNSLRFRSGFFTGGEYKWGNGDTEIVPLGFSANACGYCMFGDEKRPQRDETLSRLKILVGSSHKIEGIPLQIDLGKSNHFAASFEVDPIDHQIASQVPPIIHIVHCSAPELKSDSPLGVGLHIEHSESLRRRTRSYSSSLGEILYLEGSFARMYADASSFADRFAKQKREYIGRQLYPSATTLSNPMHLGLTGMNSCVLGSQVADPERLFPYFPVLLGPACDSFLVAPKDTAPIVQPLVPHGGGYKLDYLRSSNLFLDTENKSLMVEAVTDCGNRIVASQLNDLPFSFRRQVVEWIDAKGHHRPIARLRPILCVRP